MTAYDRYLAGLVQERKLSAVSAYRKFIAWRVANIGLNTALIASKTCWHVTWWMNTHTEERINFLLFLTAVQVFAMAMTLFDGRPLE